MRTTKVIVLNSLRDVMRFCSTLLQLKREAPKSLKLMVAVTAEQESETLWPDGVMASDRHHVEETLDSLNHKPPKKRIREVYTPPIRKGKPKRRQRRQARPVTTQLEV